MAGYLITEPIQLDDEPEPYPEAEPELEHEHEQSQNPSIEGIRCQTKHTMLKCRERSCPEYEKNPVISKESILQTHKAFMEAVCVLKDSMVDVCSD